MYLIFIGASGKKQRTTATLSEMFWSKFLFDERYKVGESTQLSLQNFEIM